MNIKRMKHAINLMDKVSMYPKETPYTSQYWIRGKGIDVMKLPNSMELIILENTALLSQGNGYSIEANLGGYIGISGMFKEAGGYLNASRHPVFKQRLGVYAIATWLDISYDDANLLLNTNIAQHNNSIYFIQLMSGFPQHIAKYYIDLDLITPNMVRSALTYYLKNLDFNGFKVSHTLATRAGFKV